MSGKPLNIRIYIYAAIENMIAISKTMNIDKISIQLSENLYYNNYKIYSIIKYILNNYQI
ncbi:MAG TPA: hypothetical protein DDZ33_07730 [Clostridium sp.]|nr:hypothetical protein [Clostridium sp.]